MTPGKIIQVTTNRRLISYSHGWMIQRLVENAKTKDGSLKDPYWTEDSPAYPATMAKGLRMVVERHFTDLPDTDMENLSNQLTDALSVLSAWKVWCESAQDKIEEEL